MSSWCYDDNCAYKLVSNVPINQYTNLHNLISETSLGKLQWAFNPEHDRCKNKKVSAHFPL